MKIMVSACLLGENCKYDGGNNRSEKLLRVLSGHTVIPVCPEVLGGLPIPRVPAEIVNGTVLNREGVSVDAAFRRGAEKALEIAEREQPDLIVLQSRSPSCGVNQVYDGTFSGVRIPGRGIFAEMAHRAGFRVMDAEDIQAASAPLSFFVSTNAGAVSAQLDDKKQKEITAMMKEENEKKNLTTEEMEKVNGGGKRSSFYFQKTTNPIVKFFRKLFGKDDSDN